ncbi:hypothetical protein [Nonlabens marinus]|nr:hypothetical protein [Nonlabens marinus]
MTVLLISCSKEVYEFDNGLRKSKFILKNSKFKYIEESNAESFKSAGTFIRTDTTLIFNFKKSEKLPFSYATREIEIISSEKDKNFSEITVINTFNSFPEFSVNVVLRDKKLNTLRILKTDSEGKVRIENSTNIYEIEIANNTFSRKAIFTYEPFKEKNILVKLILIELGGEPVDGPHGWAYYIEPIIKCDILRRDNETIAITLNDFRYDRAK